MSDEWEDVEREMNQSSGGFYKPARLPKDGSEEITVVRYSKWLDTKYPIKDKEGNSLGYTWRFYLQNGMVWDVSNANRITLLRGLHPNGGKEVVPARFKVTNLGASVNKKPAVSVEFVGNVTT